MFSDTHRSPHRPGLTLVEVLVVLFIAVVLLALVVSAIPHRRVDGRRQECKSNLHQLGLALHNYHDMYGHLPPSQIHDEYASTLEQRSRYWSWMAAILPFHDMLPHYNSIDFSQNAYPATAVSRPWTAFHPFGFDCPSDPLAKTVHPDGYSLTSYLGVSGDGAAPTGGVDCAKQTVSPSENGVFVRSGAVRLIDITDGMGTTLMIGERGVSNPKWGWWTGPGDAAWCPGGYKDVVLSAHAYDGVGGLYRPHAADPDPDRHWWSHHDGGAHFCIADGAVRFLSYNIDHNVLSSLSTRAGDNQVPQDY